MQNIRTTVTMLLAFTVLTGFAYPLAVTGLAQVLFPAQANGSLILEKGKPVGSSLIGQPFDDPRYFWGRPSATTPFPDNAASSSGSNLAEGNPALLKSVQERLAALRAADPGNTRPVPVDLVTASASGLDPDISPAAAEYQVPRVARARGLDPARVRALAANIDRKSAAPWGAGKGPADTVWMGVIDGEGRAVTFIQSTYHEYGSGVVLKDSGIVWQNRGCSFSLDEHALTALQPLRKPFHTLNPALALFDDGRSMVYGNMGGDGQPQSQSAVFTRYASFGMNPQEAVSAPRWLLGRTWGQTSDTLKLEARFPTEVVSQLKHYGHEVEVLQDWDEAMGHAGAIVRHANGVLEGGADPRSDGAVAVY